MTNKNVIIHGDCRDYISKIQTPINAVITDPPYGVDFESNNTRLPDSKKFAQRISGDSTVQGALVLFREVMELIIPKLADQAEVYVFTAWSVLDEWMPLVKSLPDLQLKQLLVWDKGYPGLGDLRYNWGCGHEMILYLKKGQRKIPSRRSSILHYDKLAAGKNIHPCLPPGEMVLTSLGYRPIETIQIGHLVYSHDGKFHSVIDRMVSHCNDGVVRIQAEGDTRLTTTTGNHPYLIYRPIKKLNAIVDSEIGWLNADEVEPGDYTMTPRSSMGRFGTGPTPEVAWVVGLWAAEGSFLKNGHGSKRHLQFALHQDETSFVDRIKSVYGDRRIGVYSKPESHGIQVVVFDSRLSERFYSWVGSGAHDKYVAPEIHTWSDKARQAFLDGYLAGDGWQRQGQVRAKTVSRNLASGLTLVAESLGYNVSIKIDKAGPGNEVNGRWIKGGPCFSLEFNEPGKRRSRPREVLWGGQEYVLHRVKTVLHLPYDGPVWNLTVEDAHTFQTYAGMTHNTEKPVGLIEKLIEMSTDPGDLVVDPFSGSGSTSHAAQNLGRNSLAFEVDEQWIEKSQARLQQIGLFA